MRGKAHPPDQKTFRLSWICSASKEEKCLRQVPQNTWLHREARRREVEATQVHMQQELATHAQVTQLDGHHRMEIAAGEKPHPVTGRTVKLGTRAGQLEEEVWP